MKPVARRRIRRLLLALGALCVSILLANLWVLHKARPHLRAFEDAASEEIIVVLGCAVRAGRPSAVLERRLRLAARLFLAGKGERVLVSGLRDPPHYDEPRAMRRFLEELGVPRERIVEDPLGSRTYETFRRAREEYGVERALIVTSAFHLARSVYLARRLGLEASGVGASDDGFSLRSRLKWEAREVIARARAVLDSGL